MKLVAIEWIDSCHLPGWVGKEEAEEAGISECTSVGLIIRKDKKEVVIAQSYSDTGNYAEITSIPVCSVVKITDIGEAYV
jgi:hypothetical protein